MSISPVFDNIEFEVNWKDWRYGKRRDCILCPVARAIARLFPGKEVLVSDSRVRVGCFVYTLCPLTCDFIEKFDRTYFPTDPEAVGVSLPFKGQAQRLIGV